MPDYSLLSSPDTLVLKTLSRVSLLNAMLLDYNVEHYEYLQHNLNVIWVLTLTYMGVCFTWEINAIWMIFTWSISIGWKYKNRSHYTSFIIFNLFNLFFVVLNCEEYLRTFYRSSIFQSIIHNILHKLFSALNF